MAEFEIILEDLVWHMGTVVVEAETLAQAMDLAKTGSQINAEWQISGWEAKRVISVRDSNDNYVDLLFAPDLAGVRKRFASSITLDTSSLDHDPAAAQAAWDAMMLERRKAKAGQCPDGRWSADRSKDPKTVRAMLGEVVCNDTAPPGPVPKPH